MANALKVLVVALFLCGLCFGEENPICKEFAEKVPDVVKEMLKMPGSYTENLKGEECPYIKTVDCGEVKYCIFVKCPDARGPVHSLKTSEVALLPDH